MLKSLLLVLRVVLLVWLIGILYGCGSGSSETRAVATAETDASSVAIYNLVTTSVGTIPDLDVASGALINKSVAITAPYLASDVQGTLRWSKSDPTVLLHFTPSGSESALFFARAALEPGSSKTLCLVGQADSLTDALKPEVLVLGRSTVAPTPGTFRVRFLNALTDVDRVDVYIASEEEIATSNSVVSPLFYKQATNYIELPVPTRGKKLIVAVTNMGASPNPGTDLIRVTGDGTIAAGHVYFVAIAHKSSRLERVMKWLFRNGRLLVYGRHFYPCKNPQRLPQRHFR